MRGDLDPRRVAEAILDAAQNGGIDANGGAVSHMNTAMRKLLPALAERMAARPAVRNARARRWTPRARCTGRS